MPNKMTKDDAARIQSSQAQNGKDTGKDSFASRAQSAADRHENQQNVEQEADFFDDDDDD